MVKNFKSENFFLSFSDFDSNMIQQQQQQQKRLTALISKFDSFAEEVDFPLCLTQISFY